MIRTSWSWLVLPGLVALALLSSFASAQGTIAGIAKDSSGAVMAGVSVEAFSEALIEKSRAVKTDGEGRYAVVDVRPGSYTVTFTIQGFTLVKEQADVVANITVTVDAILNPSSTDETVNVESVIAGADIQDVAPPEVFSRSDMDAIPSARNMQSIASLVPGVHLNTPDVGGSMQTQQTYITAHGNQSWHDTYLLDGLLINSTQFDGQVQTYVDNEIIQEATYQTSNITAEVEGGGVYVNLVPKDGGNQYHLDAFLGNVPTAFVGSNVTSAETARGLIGESRVNQIQDFDGSLGGPFSRTSSGSYWPAANSCPISSRRGPSTPTAPPGSSTITSIPEQAGSPTSILRGTKCRRCGSGHGRPFRTTSCPAPRTA